MFRSALRGNSALVSADMAVDAHIDKKEEITVATRSDMVTVVKGVESVGGRLAVHSVLDFKAKTDCSLPIRNIILGLRGARNCGLLKLKGRNDMTFVRRTSKRL